MTAVMIKKKTTITGKVIPPAAIALTKLPPPFAVAPTFFIVRISVFALTTLFVVETAFVLFEILVVARIRRCWLKV